MCNVDERFREFLRRNIHEGPTFTMKVIDSSKPTIEIPLTSWEKIKAVLLRIDCLEKPTLKVLVREYIKECEGTE